MGANAPTLLSEERHCPLPPLVRLHAAVRAVQRVVPRLLLAPAQGEAGLCGEGLHICVQRVRAHQAAEAGWPGVPAHIPQEGPRGDNGVPGGEGHRLAEESQKASAMLLILILVHCTVSTPYGNHTRLQSYWIPIYWPKWSIVYVCVQQGWGVWVWSGCCMWVW